MIIQNVYVALKAQKMENAILSQDRVLAKPALRVQIVLVVRQATLEVLVIDVSLAIPATPIVKNVSSNLTR